ncbi:hypothetical protein A4X09_0g4538 [Tilletia walkeri]|uniref:Large ribosomal subunit protein uL5 C-terminal domain-containing protein n=1 Tax=Tilletia walkeri TaxID=117179 RepID=A0A8X7T4Y3_9BASI|nr:hypothetical protein A4X09_0g4538 [Tilletia walkeri]
MDCDHPQEEKDEVDDEDDEHQNDDDGHHPNALPPSTKRTMASSSSSLLLRSCARISSTSAGVAANTARVSSPSLALPATATTTASPLRPQDRRSFSNSAVASLDHVEPRTSIPPRPLSLGPTGLSRLQEHYDAVLAPDLLYMTYDATHSAATEEELAAVAAQAASKGVRSWDSNSPYTANRPARPLRGNRRAQPAYKPVSETDPLRDLVRIERVVLTSFHKGAIGNKNALIPLIAQFRAITGVSPLGSLSDPNMLVGASGIKGGPPNLGQGHIEVVKARVGAASFKLRPGMPIGVKAVLPGPHALDFIDVLVTFVLPRLRGFQGFLLPPSSQPATSPAALSGVVSLGMGPDAMALFPQTEVNWDQYPLRGLGFQIDCITNQRGKRATERARSLLSGMGVPFVRRSAV